MELTILLLLQWLHVFFGIWWFGGTLYNTFVILPEVKQLAPEHRIAYVARTRGGRARYVMTGVAWAAVGLGALRGIVDGVTDQLATLYGETWLLSLVVGLGMIAWKVLLLDPVADEQRATPVGQAYTEIDSKWMRLRVPYLAGFFILFTLMIAMRFDY
jgi:uncharacterized membrane protein